MPLIRGVPPALMNEIVTNTFFPALLVFFDWPGMPVRAHSGTGVVNWGGFNWQGVGRFGDISVPTEALSGVPEEISMSLITDYPDLEDFTDTMIKGQEGQVYLAATTEPGGNNVIGAVELASGTGDGLSMSVSPPEGGEIMIKVTVTLRTGPSNRTPTSAVHSDEDQKRFYPNDTAGRHLALAESNAQRLLWPEP